jgi:hypothetical protein
MFLQFLGVWSCESKRKEKREKRKEKREKRKEKKEEPAEERKPSSVSGS